MYTVYAHEDPTPHTETGGTVSLAEDFGGPCTDELTGCTQPFSTFTWDIFQAQPTIIHKGNYLSTYLLLPNMHWVAGALFLPFFCYAVWWLLHHKIRTKKQTLLRLLAIGIAFACTFGVVYGAIQWITEKGEHEIIVCDPSGACTLSAHKHAKITIDLCGTPILLPLGKGDLSKSHTHTEQNIIHWHDTLPYNKETKTILDTEELELQDFFRLLAMPFDGTQFEGTKEGDLCRGTPGVFTLLVNGQEEPLKERYVWKDKDMLYLIFHEKEILPQANQFD
jgi:hypothetical protein